MGELATIPHALASGDRRCCFHLKLVYEGLEKIGISGN
jgi:threonine dehydrogenase-like Zn-dependent dehydrogenase